MAQNKFCRYCKRNKPSSREHIVADKRIREINEFRSFEQIDDNQTKGYKKISCVTCNNGSLSDYEKRDQPFLGYVTMWKVLAGNVNNAFDKDGEQYRLKCTKKKDIIEYEKIFLNIIKTKKWLPANTFSYEFDPSWINPDDSFTKGSPILKYKIKDSRGLPIENARVIIGPKKPTTTSDVYQAVTNSSGLAELTTLQHLEKLLVVEENISTWNYQKREVYFEKINVLIYIHHNYSEYKRIAIILPLIGKSTPWLNAKINRKFRSNLGILQRHIKDVKIISISPFKN